MATAEFRYAEFRGRTYPIVLLHIRNTKAETDAEALIDSGANVSIFRSDMADLLGINIEDGLRSESIGISGKVSVFVHDVEIKLFDKWFPCKVGFSKQVTTRFNLLGREDFFIRHLITFNEKERKT